MSDQDSFEAWKRSVLREHEEFLRRNAAAPQDQQLSPDDLLEAHAITSLKIESAEEVHRYLVAAREIGKSVIPNGTSTNVIDIARFLYEIESDAMAGLEESEPEPESEPVPFPGQPRNRQERRQAERHGR